MLWGQRIKVYTDHKNLVQDALGLLSDSVYRWQLLLEEFRPNIVYIKGIDNTVADAISCLDSYHNKNIKNLNSHHQIGNMVKLLMHYIDKYGGNRTQSSNKGALCLAHGVQDKMSIYIKENGGDMTQPSNNEALHLAYSVQDKMSILDIFANISKEEEIFPLTMAKIDFYGPIYVLFPPYFGDGKREGFFFLADVCKNV